MPAHNEEATIETVISQFMAEADGLGLSFKVQVIDDHSTDNTRHLVEQMGIPVYHVRHETGLASAFRTEIEAALSSEADYFIHVDADGQHRAEDLSLFLSKVSEGYDLILGNRLHVLPVNMSELRYEGNILLSKIISLLAGQVICDSQTGFRIISRRVAETCQIKSSYTYTQEQIVRASHAGFRIAEVPIFIGPRLAGQSRLMRSPFHYLARVFEDLERLAAELKPELLEHCTGEHLLSSKEKA